MLRHIHLGSMCNLRDLGGYAGRGGAVTAWETFLRGDNPSGLKEAEIQWLLERSITTVIDLRGGDEVAHKPDQLSQRSEFVYHHVTLAGGEILPNQEEHIGRAYFEVLDRQTTVVRVIRLIAAAPGGVLYHCTAGKDRTGLISALLLSLAGVCREDIVADYQVSETYLAELVRQLRLKVPDLGAWAGSSKAEYMEECLDLMLKKYGSAEDYLLAAGITSEEIEAIRAQLLPR